MDHTLHESSIENDRDDEYDSQASTNIFSKSNDQLIQLLHVTRLLTACNDEQLSDFLSQIPFFFKKHCVGHSLTNAILLLLHCALDNGAITSQMLADMISLFPTSIECHDSIEFATKQLTKTARRQANKNISLNSCTNNSMVQSKIDHIFAIPKQVILHINKFLTLNDLKSESLTCRQFFIYARNANSVANILIPTDLFSAQKIGWTLRASNIEKMEFHPSYHVNGFCYLQDIRRYLNMEVESRSNFNLHRQTNQTLNQFGFLQPNHRLLTITRRNNVSNVNNNHNNNNDNNSINNNRNSNSTNNNSNDTENEQNSINILNDGIDVANDQMLNRLTWMPDSSHSDDRSIDAITEEMDCHDPIAATNSMYATRARKVATFLTNCNHIRHLTIHMFEATLHHLPYQSHITYLQCNDLLCANESLLFLTHFLSYKINVNTIQILDLCTMPLCVNVLKAFSKFVNLESLRVSKFSERMIQDFVYNNEKQQQKHNRSLNISSNNTNRFQPVPSRSVSSSQSLSRSQSQSSMQLSQSPDSTNFSVFLSHISSNAITTTDNNNENDENDASFLNRSFINQPNLSNEQKINKYQNVIQLALECGKRLKKLHTIQIDKKLGESPVQTAFVGSLLKHYPRKHVTLPLESAIYPNIKYLFNSNLSSDLRCKSNSLNIGSLKISILKPQRRSIAERCVNKIIDSFTSMAQDTYNKTKIEKLEMKVYYGNLVGIRKHNKKDDDIEFINDSNTSISQQLQRISSFGISKYTSKMQQFCSFFQFILERTTETTLIIEHIEPGSDQVRGHSLFQQRLYNLASVFKLLNFSINKTEVLSQIHTPTDSESIMLTSDDNRVQNTDTLDHSHSEFSNCINSHQSKISSKTSTKLKKLNIVIKFPYHCTLPVQNLLNPINLPDLPESEEDDTQCKTSLSNYLSVRQNTNFNLNNCSRTNTRLPTANNGNNNMNEEYHPLLSNNFLSYNSVSQPSEESNSSSTPSMELDKINVEIIPKLFEWIQNIVRIKQSLNGCIDVNVECSLNVKYYKNFSTKVKLCDMPFRDMMDSHQNKLMHNIEAHTSKVIKLFQIRTKDKNPNESVNKNETQAKMTKLQFPLSNVTSKRIGSEQFCHNYRVSFHVQI